MGWFKNKALPTQVSSKVLVCIWQKIKLSEECSKTVPLMTDKSGTTPFSLSYFKILVKESNAYLQFIPAGGRLFCTGCIGCTKPLFQIVDTNCMTYWKTKKRVLIRHIFHYTVTPLCWLNSAGQQKPNQVSNWSVWCSFFRDVTGQSQERQWVWQLFPQYLCLSF